MFDPAIAGPYRVVRRCRELRGRGRQSVRPRVEVLEQRATPAATLTGLATVSIPSLENIDGPVADKQGNLFAAYSSGSGDMSGGVLEIHGGSRVQPDPVTFRDPGNRILPDSHLVSDSSGSHFYGTADGAGELGAEGVFEVTPGGAFHALASLDGIGSHYGDLLLDGGVLYGTAALGGKENRGTVFSVPVGGGKPTLVASFDETTGRGPIGGLVLSQGILYGTTLFGGASNSGTVFSVPAGGGRIKILADLPAGTIVNGHLVVSQGYLIGTAKEGGGPSADGAVFKLSIDGGKLFSVPFGLNFVDGRNPISGLIDDRGRIIGTTFQGGSRGVGEVFEVDPATLVITKLASFEHHGSSGSLPFGSLSVDAAGNVYGAAHGELGQGDHTTVFWKLSGLFDPPPPPRPKASVVIKQIFTADSKNLVIDYTVARNDRGTAFPIVVYRSTAPRWKQGKQVGVAGLAIRGKDAANGSHRIVVRPNGASQYAFSAKQADALRPDLKYTYVLAAADGAGLLDVNDKTNPPSASLRIHVLAVIAHGYSTDLPKAQETNTTYAAQLRGDGEDPAFAGRWYERAFAWNWNATEANSTELTNSARQLADRIEGEARKIARGNDVVDVHFIGYSRGAVLVGQALEDIDNDAKSGKAPASLNHGYMLETLVDPHPANNDRPSGWAGENRQYSASHGVSSFESVALDRYVAFQRAARDPNASVPPNVRAAVDFYQHTLVGQLPEFSIFDAIGTSEALLNLWGETPGQVDNPSRIRVISRPSTGPGIGHFEMYVHLYANVIASHRTLVDLGLKPF